MPLWLFCLWRKTLELYIVVIGNGYLFHDWYVPTCNSWYFVPQPISKQKYLAQSHVLLCISWGNGLNKEGFFASVNIISLSEKYRCLVPFARPQFLYLCFKVCLIIYLRCICFGLVRRGPNAFLSSSHQIVYILI
jgi:hypothetical protein